MSYSTATRPTRSRLFASTALAALVALPGVARGDNLPTGGTVNLGNIVATQGGAAGATGGGVGSALSADTAGGATTLDLSVTGASAVVNWNDFTVDAGSRINFTNVVNGTNFSVLNRVNGGGLPTAISGIIDGGGTGRIWVINEAGLAFGGTIQNTRGLVLSTLAVTNGAFANFETTGTQFSGTGSAGITVLGGATTPGDSGPLVLVAPAIDTAGTLTAAGDAALVVAADATVQLSAGSNIAVTIAAGTPVATANSLNISGGSLNADQIYAVGLTSTNIAAALLNVAGSLVAGNASASGSGIVLSAGRSGFNVTVNGAPQPLDVVISVAPTVSVGPATEVLATRDIVATGLASATFRSLDAGRDVTVGTTGALNVFDQATAGDDIVLISTAGQGGTGRLTSTGAGADSEASEATATLGEATLVGSNIVVRGFVSLGVGGDVSAARDFRVSGGSVSLGGSALTQTAGRFVTVDATTGNVTLNFGMTLQSGLTDATGTLAISAISGILANGAASNLIGGVDGARTNVVLSTTSGNITAGDVTGQQFNAGTLVAPGQVTFNNVAMTGDLAVDAVGNVGVNDVSSTTGNIDVRTTGLASTITARGAAATLGSVLFAATGALTVSGNVSAGAAYTAVGSSVALGTALETHSQNATTDIIVRSTATSITGRGTLSLNSAANAGGVGSITLDSNLLITGATTDLAGGIVGARTDVRILSVGGVELRDVAAATLGTASRLTDGPPPTYDVTTPYNAGGSSIFGAITTDTTLDMGSAGDLTLASATSLAGGIDIHPTNLLTITGAVTSAATFDVLLHGANNNIGGAVTSGRDLVVTGGLVNLGTAATSVSQQARGSLLVQGTQIVGAGTLTLRANSDDTVNPVAEALVLDALALGINAPTTNLVGGTVAGSITDVGVRGGAAGVTLGDVTARTFGDGVISAALPVPSVFSVDADVDAAGPLSFGTVTAETNLIINSSLGNIGLTRAASAGPVTIAAAAGTLNLATANAAVGDLTLSGSAGVTVTGLATGAANASATSSAGNVDISGTLNATAGAVTATATLGNATLANATAGTDITVNAAALTGLATLGALTAGGDVTATANGIVTSVGTTVQAGDDIDLDATGGTGGVTANGSLLANGGTDNEAGVGTLAGSNVRVRGVAAVSVASATTQGANGRDVLVSSSNGAATLTAFTAARDAVLTGNGLATIGAGSAGRDATVSGAGVTQSGTLTAGDDIDLNSTAGVIAGSLLTTGGAGIDSEGGIGALGLSNIRVRGVDAVSVASATTQGANGQDVLVSSTNGAATLTNVAARRDVAVTALGAAGVATLGGGTVGRNVSVRGTLGASIGATLNVAQDILLEAAALTVGTAGATTTLSADGELTLRATGAAGLTALGNAIVIGNADGIGGGAVNLDSAGGIFGLSPAPGLAAGFDARGGTAAQPTDVRIRLGNLASPVTLGDVTAGHFGLTDYVIAGIPTSGYIPLDAAANLTIDGTIVLGSVAVSQAPLEVRSEGLLGSLTVAAATTTLAGSNITLFGQTTLTVPGDISAAGDVSATASTGLASLGGNISGFDVTAGGAGLSLGTANLTRSVTARRDLVVRSATLTDIAALGTLTLTADAANVGGSLVLDTGRSIIGGANLSNPLGDVRINLLGPVNPTRSISLGDVTARAFGSGLASLGSPAELNIPGAITLRDVALNGTALRVVSTASDLSIRSGSTTGSFDIVLTGNSVSQTGTLSSGRDIVVSSTTGSSLATAIAARDLTVGGGGNLSITSGRAGDDIVLRPAGNVTAGSLTITGAGAALDSEGGSEATQTLGIGNLASSNIVVVADGASRNVAVTSVTATAGNTRDVTLLATNNVTLAGGSAARDLRITADFDTNGSGAALLGPGPVTAGRDITVTGTDVSASGALTAGDDIRLTATTGAITTQNLTTTGAGVDSEADGYNIVLSAATTITTGVVNSVQNTNLTATEIVLTNSISARGDLTLRATGGNGITAPGAVTLTANSDGVGGGNLTLDSAGTIAGTNLDLVAGQLVGAVLTGGSDVRIRLGNPAAAIVVRDVNAARLGSVVQTVPGPPPVYGATLPALTTGGPQTFRDIALTGSDLNLSTSAALSLRNATTAPGFSIGLGGSTIGVTGALGSGLDIVMQSAGLIDLPSATAARDINVSAGRFTVGAATADDDIVLVASGGASTAGTLIATGAGADSEGGNDLLTTFGFANLAKSNIAVSTGGDIVVTSATALANANAATNTSRDVRISATGAATVTSAAARRDLTLTGASATLTGGSALNDVQVTASTLALLGGAVTAGRDLSVNADTITATGTLTAGDDIVLAGVAGVTVADLVDTGLGTDSEGGNELIATFGQTALAASNIVLIATGNVSATAGVSNSGAASRDTRLTSTGGSATLDQTSGSTRRDISLSAATNAFARGTAGRDILVAADTDSNGSGLATLDLSQAGRDVAMTGASVLIARDSTATRDLAFTATGTATINGVVAGRDATGSAATIVVAAPGPQASGILAAGDDIVLVAGSGGVTANRLTTGGGPDSEGGSEGPATLGEANLAATNIVVRSTGAIGVSRAGPGAASVRDVRLRSTAGSVSLTDASASRDILVDANSLATLVGITSSGRDTTVTGATIVTTATQTAGDDIRLTAAGDVTAAGLAATGTGPDSEFDDTQGRLGSNIQVTAGGTATLGGAVSSARNYRVQAADIVLGNAGAVTQSANGTIDLAAARQIRGTGNLALTANADSSLNAAAEPLILRAGTLGPIPGGRSIDFGPATTLRGGGGFESDIFVILGGAANGVAFGGIEGRGFVGGVADASTFGVSTTATGLLAVAGPVDIGTLTTVEGANLAATGATGAITIGTATVLGRGAGAFVTPGLTAGDVLRLDAAQTVTVDRAFNRANDTFGGDIVVNAGTGVSIDEARASRDILVTTAGGSIEFATAAIGGTPRTAAFAGRDLALTAPLIGNTGPLDLIAGRSITATATAGPAVVGAATTTGFKLLADLSDFGAVPVSGNGAITVTATGTATLTRFSAFAAPSLNAAGDVIVTSTTGDATVGTGTASRDIRITAAGGAFTATLGDGTAGRDISLSGGNVAVTTQAVADDDIVLVASSGTATAGLLSTNATANDSEGGNEALTTLGEANLALANIVVRAAGAASVTTAQTVAGANRRDVRISGLSASLGTGTAGRDIVATSTGGAATLTTATAGRDIVLTAAGGAGTLTTGIAGRDATLSGPSLTIGSAQVGDDVVAVASAGGLTATTLTTTGLGSDSEAGSEATATLGQASLVGSNIVANASGTAAITGVVTAARDYRASGATVTLGDAGAFDQRAGGRIVIASTDGAVTLSGSGGELLSDADGATVNAAAGSLTMTAATVDGAARPANITSTGVALRARTLVGNQAQALQPFVNVASAAAGRGSVTLPSVRGGAVTISAPVAIDVPVVTASGDVLLTGVATSGNDIAVIAPVLVTIDGAGVATAGNGRVTANVTIMGGRGATASAAVANTGQIGNLSLLTDGPGGAGTGIARLGTMPSSATDVNTLTVESQTGQVIVGDAAASFINLFGRRAGSSVTASGDLNGVSGVTAAGPTVTINNARSAASVRIAATGDATLQSGDVLPGILSLYAGGTATLGSGTAGGGLSVVGGTLNVTTQARSNDDVILLGRFATSDVNLAAATITAGGLPPIDLQSGNDDLSVSGGTTSTVAGTGYGLGQQVISIADAVLVSPLTGNPIRQLGGNNVTISGRDVTLGTVDAARDVRVEAGRTATLGVSTSTGRDLIVAAGLTQAGILTAASAVTAGDDLILSNARGDVVAGSATLVATGLGGDGEGGSDTAAARRADHLAATPSLVADPTGSGSITRLGGANIVVAASGAATVGSATAQTAARDVRIAANGAATLATATARRDLLVLGGSATTTGAVVAGDDIAVVARGGNASVATAATTGAAVSNETLVTDTLRDLSGNALALPGEAALTRIDGASILVAATGTATLPGTVTSAGSYTVLGRGGVALGEAGAVTQSAARDVSIGGSLLANAPASIVLSGDLTLLSNSDGAGPGDGVNFALANGSVDGAAAVIIVGRSAAETLGNQGRATTTATVADGVKAVTLLRVDAPFADLRALNAVAVGDAIFDGGFTLASKAATVSLGTATVSNLVPLASVAERGAVDLKLFGTTGATLGSTANASDGLLRDVTVTTSSGAASVTRAAARDDIVVASTSGAASAATLVLTGAPSDSELGNAAATLADATGAATRDAYGLTGPNLASLAGSNIVVSGATTASLDTATTAAGSNDVRVQTLGGTATLTAATTNPARIFVASRTGDATAIDAAAGQISVLAGSAALLQTGNAGGSIVVDGGTATALDATAGTSIAVTGSTTARLALGNAGIDIVVTANGGDATATTANAARDVFVASTGGIATLTTGTAGRDTTLTGPSIVIGTATAGDDIVAAASAGTLTAGTLTATGLGSDNEATDMVTAKRSTGADIANPALAAAPPIVGIRGSNVVAVASGDVTITDGVTAARGIQLGSLTGVVNAALGAATTGDISIIAPVISAPSLTAGGTITARSTVGATTLGVTSAAGLVIDAATDAVVLTSVTLGGSATITAGQDILIGSAATPGSTVLTTGSFAQLTAGRSVTIFQPVSIGTDLAVTAGTGTIGLASFTAGGGATLRAAGDIGIAGLARSGAAIAATSTTGAIGVGTLEAGTDATLLTRTNVVGGTTTTGGALTATATDGAIQLASLSAGRAATLTAGTDVTVAGLAQTGTALPAGASTGGDFTATAGSGAISLGQLTAATAATLSARGSAVVIGAAAAGGDFAATSTTGDLGFASLDAGGNATLRAAGGIAVGGLARSGRAFDAIATNGALTAATLTAGSSATLTSGGATTVTGAATSATAFNATSTGSSIAFGSLGAGGAAILRAQTDVTTGAATSGGDFAAMATTGSLAFASLGAGGSAMLNAAQAIDVAGAATSTGAFGATATNGALGFGSLGAAGAATLRAGGDMRVANAARSGGAFDARSTGGAVRFGSLDAGAAASLIAATSLRVDELARVTGAATVQTGTTLQLGALNAGSVTLTAGTDLTVDGDAATGSTLTATATNGSFAARSITAGGAATLTAANDIRVTDLARAGGALTARATAGALRMGSLDALSAMLTAQRDLSIDAGATTRGTTFAATSTVGNIGVGSLDARSDATLTATAGTMTLGNGLASAVRTGGKLTLVAAGTTAVRGGVAAAGDYLVTSGGAITLSGDGLTQSGATATLNAPDLTMTGGAGGIKLASPGAAGRVQLNVRGTPVTRVAIGDNLTASNATSFTLDASEVARISSPKFEIDADNGLNAPTARAVDIGRATIDAGVTQFAVRARGDLTLVDTLSFRTAGGGAPRTMTLGGSLDGGPLDKVVATNPLANSIRVYTRLALDNATPGTGGQIDAVGSTVGLRANYILLGLRPTAPDAGLPFIDAILPPGGTPLALETVRSQYFANPTSTFFSAQPFYNRAATPQASVKATNLVLAPAQYALIQNTGASAQLSGGIEVTSLRLVKTTTIDPLVGVFGSIDSQNGVVASVRISADQLDGIVPFNVRINGCIALQSASCILTGVTLPLVTLVDPSNALLVSNNSGLSLPLELVTGASNEVLWRECEEGSDAPGCQAAETEAAPTAAVPAGATPPAVEPARPTGNQ